MLRLVIIVIGCMPILAHASQPTVDSIDYSKPESYVAIPSSLGQRDNVAKHAAALKGRDDRATVRNVLEWMEKNLKCDPKKAYEWRNYDDVVREGCYGSCSDQGVVCGTLLKAAGIPTVWVKSMDVTWIWDFKKGRPFESWSGHLFLEVYLDKHWVLLDPGAKLIYTNYSPNMRILPGNRFAYHKGDNPKQMLMSMQWEEWKQQSRTYFAELDGSLLPVDTKSAESLVPQVYIIGNDPYYQVLTEMVRRKGWSVQKTFNTNYDKLLPLAKGHTLLIETQEGVPIVASEVLDKFYPKASAALKTRAGVTKIDGTTIYFVDFAKTLIPVDTKGAKSVVPQVYIVGNAPYYQALTAMARLKGLSVQKTFNTNYDNLLPLAKGYTLLIETQEGVPIVASEVLEKYYPKASDALKTRAKVSEIEGTTIYFVDFAKALDALDEDAVQELN